MRVRPGLVTSKLFIRACLEYGRLEEARARLELLRKTDPKDADLMWLASAYAKMDGNLEEADKLQKMALAADPEVAKRLKLYMRNKPIKVTPPGMVTFPKPVPQP